MYRAGNYGQALLPKKMRDLTTDEFKMIETSAERYIEVGRAAKSGNIADPPSRFSVKPIPE